MGSGETVSPVQKKGCCPSPEQAREHQPSAYRSPASASTASDARVVVLFDRVWLAYPGERKAISRVRGSVFSEILDVWEPSSPKNGRVACPSVKQTGENETKHKN
jgi:hypothetical protein